MVENCHYCGFICRWSHRTQGYLCNAQEIGYGFVQLNRNFQTPALITFLDARDGQVVKWLYWPMRGKGTSAGCIGYALPFLIKCMQHLRTPPPFLSFSWVNMDVMSGIRAAILQPWRIGQENYRFGGPNIIEPLNQFQDSLSSRTSCCEWKNKHLICLSHCIVSFSLFAA